jgi:hypothetical protein
MRFCLVLLFLAASLIPARADVIDTAFDHAIHQFETALPQLPAELFGVDIAAYRDALTLRSFSSPHWGGTTRLSITSGSKTTGSCDRYAAFVRLPPENGRVTLTLCPQFLTPGADGLRTLTVLHEIVHVVAGPNECRAMAFAARIEKLATGAFTDVTRYWQANKCEGSAFRLP